MDPISVRDLAPRFVLGLAVALAAAAGAFAVHYFDGSASLDGSTSFDGSTASVSAAALDR